MKRFVANINDEGLSLIKFCQKTCPKISSGELFKAFRKRRIKVNGKRQYHDYRIKKDDVIELYINDELFEFEENKKYIPETNLSLNYPPIYEDKNILLVIKPFGLLSHSDNKNQPNLISQITNYLLINGDYLPENENTFKPALCNRIDQGTEGLVIAAKNYMSLKDMNKIIKDNLLEKYYIFITKETPPVGYYEAYLKRDLKTKKVTVKNDFFPGSNLIKTYFSPLERKNGFNLVECQLLTGKTHQIRAHSAFLQAPILGDKKYGLPFKGLKSQMLCAYKLKFKKIPSDNYLSYLSEKEIVYSNNNVINFFNSL